MLKEFKAFAIQGNLVDTAVAFVMGAAFGKVTTSFIEGIVMPLVGQVVDADFSKIKYVLVEANAAAKIEEVSIKYGEFITAIINLLIVAAVMFMIIKAIAKAKKSAEKEAAAAPPPAPPVQEVLLSEIRDLLKSGR